MYFPQYRLRRLRQRENLRRLVREVKVSLDDLIYPLFVVSGTGLKEEIEAMPGVYHLSVDVVAEEAKEIAELGIPAVIVFGVPESKDEVASGAYAVDGVVQEALRAMKRSAPELILMTDVCLCAYMSHGHCGVVEDGRIVNDRSVELLAKTALSHAQAGAEVVAPSDMMDGRVGAIRNVLDEASFEDVPILSYAAKYASSFYGPFREAAESTPQFGDRHAYQMDPANIREALREVALDIEEGADMVMVKPALAYLDVIQQVKAEFEYPVAAYNVSGEYSIVKAAAAKGWIEEEKVALEVLTAIKRAGADMILTYHAKDVARALA